MPEPRVITKVEPVYPFLFSICTIVNNREEYHEMKQSFEQCGFSEGCEYLMVDNTNGNTLDAYQGIAAFMKQAQGQYLVIVHQDVRCIDTKARLVQCLQELTAKDNKWAVCGNAGIYGYHGRAMHLQNDDEVIVYDNLPARVYSLDENLLIVNRATNLTVSGDLSGYHLYGTDLCLLADILGYTCYVIPFMVNHLSKGNLQALEEHIPNFWSAYGRKLRSRYVETTCTKFYLSNGVAQTKVYNAAGVFSLLKVVERLKQVAGLVKNGKQHKRLK